MKENFENPELEIIDFGKEDIVTSSSGWEPYEEEEEGWPGWGHGDNNHDHDKEGVHDRGNHGKP